MTDLSSSVLIIAAVAWRRDNLIRMLQSAKAGGVVNIMVIFDGEGWTPEAFDSVFEVANTFNHFEYKIIKPINKIRGYGERWYQAAYTAFPIVQILDDDLWVEPAYFKHNLNQLLEINKTLGGRLISLGGFLDDLQTYRDIGHVGLAYPERLNTCQNNAVTFFSDVAAGMVEKMGDVLPLFYGKPGEDEGPVSCYCWLEDISMYRPAGGQPVTYWPPYQNDERGLFISCASKVMYPLRDILNRRYGWRWKGTAE